MKSKYAALNGLIGVILFFLTMIFGLVRQRVLIDNLGPNYVGISALFGDLLIMLNMADIGLSGAVGAVLYKPILEKNYPMINGIIGYYKKIYRYAGLLFLILTIIALFGVGFLIDSHEISDTKVRFYFTISAFNVLITYFWSYRLILITTNPKLFYLNSVTTLSKITAVVIQIFVLLSFKSFSVFLVADIIGTVLYISILNTIIKKKYPILKEKDSYIEDKTKYEIIKSLKGLVFHKTGTVIVFGTNYIYTTLFSGLTHTAIYSNYQLLFRAIEGIISNFFSALTSTIGIVIATEENEKRYYIFQVLFLINFWLVSLAAIIFYNTSEIFISLWVGEKYLVSKGILILFTLYIFIMFIRPATEQFKFASGLFYEDRYIPVIEAIVNLISCLSLGYFYGMTGVVAGNLISTLLVITWQKPFMVFKYVFKRSLIDYFKIFIPYFFFGVIVLFISNYMISFIYFPITILGFAEKVLFTAIIVNGIYILVFWRTIVFQELRKYSFLLLKVIEIKFLSYQKKT